MKVKRSFLVVVVVLSMSALAFAAFVQSFEFDTFDWTAVARVPTLTNDIPSESGTWHAEAGSGAFTRWGGYSETFPPGGYVTTVDIYLDISPPYMTGMTYPNDTRFDWTSAVSTPACAHRRDFAFNAGFYTDGMGMVPRFVISASNNTGRGNSFPKNPERDPFIILVEGWYTFEHEFYAVPPTPGGQLYVNLTIKNAVTGAPLHTWTLSDPSDIIGTTVGGNRYGWFPTNEFDDEGLPIDTSALVGFQDYCPAFEPGSTAGAKITGGGWIEATGGGKGTFGLTAQVKGEAPNATASGNVTYHDPNRKVKSVAITSVVVMEPCATIRGDAKVNDSPTPMGFEVRACDMGDPGDNQDTFSITLFDGYTAGGELQGGNIQLH
jgi:hypothetical protein